MEDSIEDSDFVELYLFSGTFTNYYYTPSRTPILGGGNTYSPVAGLTRSSIKIGSHEDENDTISVQVPIMSQLSQDNAFQTTPPDLDLVIYRMQRSSGILETLWRGPVTSISITGLMVKFKVPSVFTSLLQSGFPTFYVQPQCNHVLFDDMCRLNRASFTTSTTVTAVDGKDITVGSIGAFAASRYVSGEILSTVNGQRRTINSVVGNVVKVGYEFVQLQVGDAVELVIGCDHSWAGSNGCLTNNNRVNFGGFPYMAGETSNVFRVGIV